MFPKTISDPVLIGEPYSSKQSFTLFDSKLGGQPLWLTEIPKEYPYHCEGCGKELYLLVQVYEPIDDYERVIYVFCCRNTQCQLNPSGWRCIRQQTTITGNETSEPPRVDPKPQSAKNMGLSFSFGSSGGGLSGLSSNADLMTLLNKMESKLPSQPIEKEKIASEVPKGIIDSVTHPCFQELFIDIFDEPRVKSGKVKIADVVEDGRGEGEHEGYDTDKRMNHLIKFNTIIKPNPSQILRIAYPDGHPLLPISNYKERIPSCPCGCNRVFELQILPTILSFLDLDEDVSIEQLKEEKEWSSVIVYTCKENCDHHEEVVAILPPLWRVY